MEDKSQHTPLVSDLTDIGLIHVEAGHLGLWFHYYSAVYVVCKYFKGTIANLNYLALKTPPYIWLIQLEIYFMPVQASVSESMSEPLTEFCSHNSRGLDPRSSEATAIWVAITWTGGFEHAHFTTSVDLGHPCLRKLTCDMDIQD